MPVRDSFLFYSCKTEETKLSDRYGAYGILSSIIVSIVVGWGYILGLSFTVIDPTSLLDPANDAGGYAVAQLFYGVFRDRYGSGTGGIVCLGIIAVAVYLGGLGCVTSNSRYASLFILSSSSPYVIPKQTSQDLERPSNTLTPSFKGETP